MPDSACLITDLPVFGLTAIFASNSGICAISFPSSPPASLANTDDPARPLLKRAIDQLHEYFAGRLTRFDLPCDLSSLPEYQQQVLRLTAEIPFGSTRTYGDLAAEIQKNYPSPHPIPARSVGAAVANNPIPIIIPCHRVVSSGGRLRGYSAPGGLETKAWLLQLEGARLIA